MDIHACNFQTDFSLTWKKEDDEYRPTDYQFNTWSVLKEKLASTLLKTLLLSGLFYILIFSYNEHRSLLEHTVTCWYLFWTRRMERE